MDAGKKDAGKAYGCPPHDKPQLDFMNSGFLVGTPRLMARFYGVLWSMQKRKVEREDTAGGCPVRFGNCLYDEGAWGSLQKPVGRAAYGYYYAGTDQWYFNRLYAAWWHP